LEKLELIDPILGVGNEHHECLKKFVLSKSALRFVIWSEEEDHPEIQLWKTLPRVSVF